MALYETRENLCSNPYPRFFCVLNPSFSIFHRSRPLSAVVTTFSFVWGILVMYTNRWIDGGLPSKCTMVSLHSAHEKLRLPYPILFRYAYSSVAREVLSALQTVLFLAVALNSPASWLKVFRLPSFSVMINCHLFS